MSIEGTCISTCHDEYGPIYVYQTRTSRILSFDRVVEQSRMSLNKPDALMHKYTQAMMTGLVFIPGLHTATILGLGAGSITKCLLKKFHNTQIHAIEYRQGVIKTAQKYFHLPTDKRLHLHIDDAVSYMKTCPVKSDIIFSDLYNARGMEPRQIQLTYLHNCKKSLTDHGVLVLNLWHQDFSSEAEIEDLLSHEFENRLLSFPVEGGNTIVLAFKNEIPAIERKTLLKKAKTIQQLTAVPVERYAKLIWNEQQFRFASR